METPRIGSRKWLVRKHAAGGAGGAGGGARSHLLTPTLVVFPLDEVLLGL